eukprot:jgi/Chrzof1/11431/Cz05g36140.t1
MFQPVQVILSLFPVPHPPQASGLPASPIHGTNQWPYHLPAFDASLRRYLDSMRHLGAHVLRGIALGLGLPEQYFGGRDVAAVEGCYWVARVLHYPPLLQAAAATPTDAAGAAGAAAGAAQVAATTAAAAGAVGTSAAGHAAPSHIRSKGTNSTHNATITLFAAGNIPKEVQLSCGEHTDYGLLTIVNQDTHMTALQVKNAEGTWVNAEPISGAFVCNIGDMLKVWTNGLYRPTVHRVINSDPSQSRVSIPFFYEPCYETVVSPLPQFCRDKPPAYAPVRYGSHLESKVLTNFEL